MSDVPGLVEHFHYIGLFILLVLGGMGLPFPEGITLMICGFLISNDVIRPIYALIVVLAGMLIGDFIIFYVGRKYGRMILTRKKFYKILSPAKLSILEDKFNKWGTLFIIIGRHLGFHVFLVAGVMRMPYLKFLVLDVISSFFAIIIMVGAGYLGGNSFQIIRKDITRVEHIAVLIIIILLVIWLLLRYFKSRNRRTEL